LALIRRNKEAYAQSARISLISSLIPSLLAGKVVGIDSSDASGMNLLNIHTLQWEPKLIEYIDNVCGISTASLRDKLGE
jgi:xylulokinase